MLLELTKQNKIKLLKLFFMVNFSAVFFTSCSWWEKQTSVATTASSSEECDIGNSPFIVNQITKSPNDEAITLAHGADGLTKTFTLNLTTCIRDLIRQDTPIQNAPFVVEYYNSSENKRKNKKEKVTAISDTQGCIQWQEKYKYKYTVKPPWIGLERTIKKESGAYAGAETIPMAINPWLSAKDKEDGLPSILDTRCEYSRQHHIFDDKKNYNSNGLNYLKQIKKKEYPFLWAPTVSIQYREISPEEQQATHRLANSSNKAETEAEAIRKMLKKYQQICQPGKANDCYKRRIEMGLYIPLYLRTLDMSSLTHRSLHGGTYDVDVQLVISPEADRKNYLLHEDICSRKKEELEQASKSLSFTCKFSLSYFNQNALYKLVIRIKPSSTDLPFKKFEGIYTINLDFNVKNEIKEFNIDTVYDEAYKNVLHTDKELTIIDSMNILKIRESDEGNKKYKEGNINIQEGKIHGVNFYPLQLDGYGEYKLSHIKGGGTDCSERENVVQRTAVFVGKVCLNDVLESQKLKSTRFRVFLEKPRENSIKEIYYENQDDQRQFFETDGFSCISIPIELKHNLYDRQKYFQVDIHVLSEELNLYGKVRLALSPWQRAFQAFQDAQNLNDKIIRFDTEGVPKPQLIINQYRSIKLFPSYGLDKLLNIHLFHRIYFLFQPFVRRPDNLSLGLGDRARELLRDGYYLVRILILRNPQEIGDSGPSARADTVENQNEDRKNNISEDRIDLKDLEASAYITHTDSVVLTKANFVNFYMPIYLSTKQFYYIASRNFVVIEIHPANPLKFRYKGDDCHVDTEATKWEPFFDHELENFTYAGAKNIQLWTNWNLLQPVKGVNTDKIIEQSEIGKKYKHFNFSSEGPRSKRFINSEDSEVNFGVGCVNEIDDKNEVQKIEEKITKHLSTSNENPIESANPTDQEIDECANNKSPWPLSPSLESYKNNEEPHLNIDVLKGFAEESSLRLVNMSSDEGKEFLQDMETSFNKYQLWGNVSFQGERKKGSQLFNFLDRLPNGDGEFLKLKVLFMCKFSWTLPTDNSRECVADIVGAYLKTLWRTLEEEDLLHSLFDIILDEKLIRSEQRVDFKKTIQQCRVTQKTSTECYDSVKTYISEAIDYSVKESLPGRHLLGEMIHSILSFGEKEKLFEEVHPCHRSASVEKYEECYYGHLKTIFDGGEQFIVAEEQDSDLLNAYKKMEYILSVKNFLRISMRAGGEVIQHILQQGMQNEDVSFLIQRGVLEENKYDLDVMSFSKSLCFFWFDFYIKNYLQKDQMISAYTNYVQKFDYHQVLETNLIPYEEKISYLPSFIEQAIIDDPQERLSSCYHGYAKCLIVDHCQERTVNTSKEKYCPNVEDIPDETCPKLLAEECRKNSSLSLCENECLRYPENSSCTGKNLCNVEVRDFCKTNKDQKLCEKYENRCLNRYLPCLRQNKNSDLFTVKNVLNYKHNSASNDSADFPPLKTCLRNPYEFFKFENKMVVHEIAKDNPKYESGYLKNLAVSVNHSIGSYLHWSAQRQRSIYAGIKSNLNLFSFLRITPSADFGINQSASSNESNSGRRAIDDRVGESLFLLAGTANITVGVTKFQKCLVIKPRPNAFTANFEKGEPTLYEGVWHESIKNKDFKKVIISRPGLILCNPIEHREERNAEKITESYYYISHQGDAQNSQFLNLYDLANRPFLMVLRGRKEFLKLYQILRQGIEGNDGDIDANGNLNKVPENMFVHYPFPIEESIGLALATREFSETGFHPGIFNYPDSSDEIMDIWYAQLDKKEWLMDPLTSINLFNTPNIPGNSIPIQNRTK